MDFGTEIIFAILAALLFLGAPIAVAIGLTVIAATLMTEISWLFLAQKLVSSLNSFPLLAVPLFIMAGEIMRRGSMAQRLLNLARCLVGHITGGLAQVSILTSLFFGSLSGSSPATVAAVGGIMIPAMKRDGYDSTYATAVNTSAGCLGVMIPPSIPLIIYGTTAGVSVGDLFIAGILPGLVVAGSLMMTAYIIAKVKGIGAPEARASFMETLRAFRAAFHALMVPVIVLGGIYGGIMTPTEAGISAVIYALLAETIFLKTLSFFKVWDVLKETALTTASIFLVVATASALGQVFLFNNVPAEVVAFLTNVTENKLLLLLIIILVLVILGTFMDALANILILTPLFLPVAQQLGVDPLHFGIIMIISVATGFLTPPVGVNLFVGCGIGKVSIERLSLAVLPFLGTILLALGVITIFPWISLALVP